MDENKQREEVSLVGRILTMEAFLLLMGFASLGYGIWNAEMLNVAMGAGIIIVIFSLMHRRKSK